MGSVFSALVRGLLGVVVTLGIVAIVWTLYLKRDAVLAASEPVVDWVLARQSAAKDSFTATPEAARSAADAPVVGSRLEPRSAAREDASTDPTAVAPTTPGSDSDTGSGKQ